MKLIYLATPYSTPDPARRAFRFNAACAVAYKALKHGAAVYAPIVSWHQVKLMFDLKGDWEEWKDLDKEMISRCDELWVVKINGWEKSKGIKNEIELAQAFGKPVKYLRPEEL